MIKLPMDVYIKNLASYVHDDDKLVTYKWLSKELEIHVNIAKQILEEYWKKHKGDVVATILIIGHLKNGGMRVEVVQESDLPAALEKYQEIISQHVYSLQKTLPDIQLLAGTGKGDAKFGAINCEKCVILSDEELFSRRWGSAAAYQAPLDVKPVEKKEITKKSSGIADFVKESAKKSVEDKPVEKPEELPVSKKITPPKGKASDKKGTVTKKPVQSQKTGFSNLFGKVTTANQKVSPPTNQKNQHIPMDVDSESSNEKASYKSNLKPAASNGEVKKVPEKKESPKNGTTKNNELPTEEKKSTNISPTKGNNYPKTEAKGKNKKPRGTKRGRSQDTKSDAKKRKRIVVISDSEDSAGSDDEPSVIEDSPPREPSPKKRKSPSPPPVQNINGKRKVRKLVDKTYEDEDGFMVTKKVHVYESCSEEDEPVKAPSPKKPSVDAAKIKKQNKQTSLMNFFKKV